MSNSFTRHLRKNLRNTSQISSTLGKSVRLILLYSNVFGNYELYNFQEKIASLPLIESIRFIINTYSDLLYSFSDTSKHELALVDFINLLAQKGDYKAVEYLKSFKGLILTNESLYLLLAFILRIKNNSNHSDLTKNDNVIIFKSLLYCNDLCERIKCESKLDSTLLRLEQRLILADIPFSEFRLHKNFFPATYKAILFFQFCEQSSDFSKPLLEFYKLHKIDHWGEYLSSIYNILHTIILHPIINKAKLDKLILDFIEEFVFIKEDLAGQYREEDDYFGYIRFFRDRFILMLNDEELAILDSNFLIDKIYQSLRFSFKDMEDSSGKKFFPNFSDFMSKLGAEFSEQYMFYKIMEKSFNGVVDECLSGSRLQEAVNPPPDYYVRIGANLLLFEFKDNTLADSVKYSGNIKLICESILSRLCMDNGRTRKGVGQLYKCIESMDNDLTQYKTLDRDCDKTQMIYPIIVTTDLSFSSYGVNNFVIQNARRIKDQNHYKFKNFIVENPIIINIDTFILMAYSISAQKINFIGLLNQYLHSSAFLFKSFDAICYESNLVSETDELMNYLFRELLPD